MGQRTDIGRNASGSIDINAYRVVATQLRREAMRDKPTLRKGFASMLATAAVLGLVSMLGAIAHPDADHVATAHAVTHALD